MGIFGGIGKALKGIDWDRVSTGLSAAGASASGDHGTAAQIWAMRGKRQQEQRESEAERQQAEALVQAAVRAGIPEQQARSLPPQTLAGVVAQTMSPPSDNEFTRTLRAAGIDPASPQGQALYRQRAATMASPAPVMTGSPATGYQWNTPPPPQVPGLTAAQPAPQPQQQAPFTFNHYRGARSSLGPEGAASWLQRSGVTVSVNSPQEAQQLPPGTKYTTPDGREFVR